MRDGTSDAVAAICFGALLLLEVIQLLEARRARRLEDARFRAEAKEAMRQIYLTEELDRYRDASPTPGEDATSMRSETSPAHRGDASSTARADASVSDEGGI